MHADLKPYPRMKDAGAEWLGRVPSHWEVRRLRTVVSIVNGATPSTSKEEYWDGEVLWLTPEDLGSLISRRVADSTRRISHEGLLSCGASLVMPGSIAISTRAPIGHLGILGSPGCTNQGCRTLVPNAGIKSECLYWVLNAGRSELESTGQGTTFSELSRSKLGDFRVPVPPLQEQSAIASFLDRTNARVDRYIRAKEKLIDLLEEQKQVEVHEAVTGQVDIRTGRPYPAYEDSGVRYLRKIPQQWRAVRLGRLTLARCDGPFGSGLKSSHYADGGVRVVRLQNIGSGTFNGEDAVYIAPAHYATLGDHTVQPNDLLIAGLGDPRNPAGRACVAPANVAPAMVKADCFRFRMDEAAIHPEFAALQLTATALAASALLSTGATRQRINLESTARRLVGLPTLSEQARLVEYCHARAARLDAGREAARREILLLNEYRARLIAEAVTGKVDVRNVSLEGSAAGPEVDAELRSCPTPH